jgi:hypothetical protein
LAYGAASFLHFAHNAVFSGQYPNLPVWLSPLRICAAWFGVTSVGIIGYLLLRLGLPVAGLAAVAIYAAFGFDGLSHYALAPVAAHTPMMNLTIWLEAAAAALLLISVAGRFVRQWRLGRKPLRPLRG